MMMEAVRNIKSGQSGNGEGASDISIAGLSDVLYVIDAGKNSGTKTTVEAAERYGKQIVKANFYKDV